MLAQIWHWLTHVHSWETDQIIQVYDGWDDEEIRHKIQAGNPPSWKNYVLRCKTCGTFKKKRIG